MGPGARPGGACERLRVVFTTACVCARWWRGWVQARGGMGGNKVARVGAAGGCSGAGGREWVHLRCVRPGVVTADCITYNGPPPARPGDLPVLWPGTVTANSGSWPCSPTRIGWSGPARPGGSVLYLIRHW